MRMMPLALAVPRVLPVGLDRVTVKPLSCSTLVSPATSMLIVLDVSPAAKDTVPEGRMEPVKSAATAGLVPDPLTAHSADELPEVSPWRLTEKV